MNSITIDNKKYYLITDLDLTCYFDLWQIKRLSRYIFYQIYLHQLELYAKVAQMQTNGIEGLFFITLRPQHRIPERMCEDCTITPLTGTIKGYFLQPKIIESTITPVLQHCLLESRKMGLPFILNTLKEVT